MSKTVSDIDEYQSWAVSRAKPGIDLLTMTTLGLNGEAGEYAELVKKHLFHRKPLNPDDVISELGDVLWYLAVTSSVHGISLTQLANHNMNKLINRHGENNEGLS
jgi:NTP pyrophosphatase (non-canonical NTP hydrolase)